MSDLQNRLLAEADFFDAATASAYRPAERPDEVCLRNVPPGGVRSTAALLREAAARLAEVLDALEPFAELAEVFSPSSRGTITPPAGTWTLQLSDSERARALLRKNGRMT